MFSRYRPSRSNRHVSGVAGKSYRGSIDPGFELDNFDANNITITEWATFIPRHRGAFHMHPNRGAALRALNPRFIRFGILYRRQTVMEYRDAYLVGVPKWVEVARVDDRVPHPLNCDGCGVAANNQPPVDPDSKYPWAPKVLTPCWLREGRKIPDPPRVGWLCWACDEGGKRR